MDDSGNNGHTATDVITYIGVPLAVLGVLPILYNTVMTLSARSRIKRMLRHSRLTALTRSDIVNRVIEVELPRYAVRPLDRFTDRAEYWTLSRHPSSIPGGSWTTFNWRTNIIGHSTQRVEYADQLRQPQVEVAFDELVCYLLDLGAVPDPHGWRLLRSTGLWTPVGCALMLSPDGKEKALAIAPLDGSEGHLSLAVTWAGPWTTRDYSQLPPYWVRLPPPRSSSSPPQPAEQQDGETEDSKPNSTEGPSHSPQPPHVDSPASSVLDKPSLDSARQQGLSGATGHPITCQISVDGIVTALVHPTTTTTTAAAAAAAHSEPAASTASLHSLYIDHLRPSASSPPSASAWFASAATAYGTTSQTILWNYKIPDAVLAFARRETVPCGVLVLLGAADESETPEWSLTSSSAARSAAAAAAAAQMETHMRRHAEQRRAMEEEARMTPERREAAVRERLARESLDRMAEMRDRLRQEAQRKETRVMEALQSPKWDTRLVAEHNLEWLKRTGAEPDDVDMREAVGTVLHRMVLDGRFSSNLCRMLDLWKAWAENGGMRRSDLTALQEDQTTFAYATLLVAVIKDTSTALEGTLSMDLQECLRMWRTIRLG
ncbi:hypothetical protein VTK26DRAFT_8521 [Humicola hyalothermophila]